MSTFDGHIREFPTIQVDYFRRHPSYPQPLACFLSHVHSDHLVGLEGLRSPFVYCSAATRALVLRLEKYPNRLHYEKGLLEARKPAYKGLCQLLKPLPLETPTTIELSLGTSIRVTLLDANHCPGSVMFLFEDEAQAVLYTGDTRCEPWFVNALVRSPCLVEYTTGLRHLDTVYLDTTCIDKDARFPTKAEGLGELLRAVSRYPPDTIFHLRAWTFGYEDVWIALAKSLHSKVHMDAYTLQLYQSLSVCRNCHSMAAGPSHLTPEAPALVGFHCANTWHEGCLAADKGQKKSDRDGQADGISGEDDDPSPGPAGPRMRIHSCDKGMDYCPTVRNAPVVWIRPVSSWHADDNHDGRDTPNPGRNSGHISRENDRGTELPTTIVFPYSRHSSYKESCHLLDKLRPRDVWPCTVNPTLWFRTGAAVTIRDLFGSYCSGNTFRHDKQVASQWTAPAKNGGDNLGIVTLHSQACTTTSDDTFSASSTSEGGGTSAGEVDFRADRRKTNVPHSTRAPALAFCLAFERHEPEQESQLSQDSQSSQNSVMTEYTRERYMNARKAILHNATGALEWVTIGLASTCSDNHTYPEVDLGTD